MDGGPDLGKVVTKYRLKRIRHLFSELTYELGLLPPRRQAIVRRSIRKILKGPLVHIERKYLLEGN